jgi:hypothetical protein
MHGPPHSVVCRWHNPGREKKVGALRGAGTRIPTLQEMRKVHVNTPGWPTRTVTPVPRNGACPSHSVGPMGTVGVHWWATRLVTALHSNWDFGWEDLAIMWIFSYVHFNLVFGESGLMLDSGRFWSGIPILRSRRGTRNAYFIGDSLEQLMLG